MTATTVGIMLAIAILAYVLTNAIRDARVNWAIWIVAAVLEVLIVADALSPGLWRS